MIGYGFEPAPTQRPRPRLVCTVIAAESQPSARVVRGPWRPVVVKGGRAS